MRHGAHTEVTNVPLRVRGSTVVLAVGVEVGTGRGTAVGVVSKFVDVEASLGVGVEVLDLIGDYQVSKWMVTLLEIKRLTSPETVTGAPSFSWVKVITPVTGESPLRTATACIIGNITVVVWMRDRAVMTRARGCLIGGVVPRA